MTEITCDIKRHIATIIERPNGWTFELNLVSWNRAEPKYDLRNWSPDHEKSSKQASYTIEELMTIKNVLNNIFPD